MSEYELSVIGAGRVATQLATALHDAGVQIRYIYSRNSEKANLLASRLASSSLSGDLADCIASLPLHTAYLICVPDDAIPSVFQQLDILQGTLIHTAGAVALPQCECSHTGVLYPLQTFSPNRTLNMTEIPFFIEASDPITLQWLQRLVQRLSPHVNVADSATRQWLHLLGVITNNFTNHLLAEAEQIAQQHGISFQSLRPLVEETIQKAFETSPTTAQTGPAVRSDESTIAKHQRLIAEAAPDLLPLYNLFTEAIRKRQRSK